MPRDETYTYFLQDIERYFQIDSRREKRKKECITIVRTSNTDKIAYDGGKIDLVISYDEDDTFHLYGGLMSSLRSEEHTSELQSLMRISYAVFCLKKKTINTSKTTTNTPISHTTSYRRNNTLYIQPSKHN